MNKPELTYYFTGDSCVRCEHPMYSDGVTGHCANPGCRYYRKDARKILAVHTVEQLFPLAQTSGKC